MNVWELRCGNVNDFSMIVPAGPDISKFDVNGLPIAWMSRPVIEYADSRSRGKKKRPVADVAAIGGGAFVLSPRAKEVLGPFLTRFGQLLEVQTSGGDEFRYFYNVTHLVSCVDLEASEKSDWGSLKKEVFDEAALPRVPAVFKDPNTAAWRMYTNDAGREILERLSSEAALTGLEVGPL